jgi:hypothetical protein
MKKLFIILILLLTVGCSSTKNDFYKRKYPTETKKSYKEKRGLMILNSTYLGRNKEYNSKHNINKKKQAYKKYKRTRK